MKNIRNVSAETIELFESEGYENRTLPDYEIRRRLEAHGVEYTESEGKIIALELFGNGDADCTDTTDWTLFDLLDFLNY